MSESYADEETFKQIRARREAEFAAKYPNGIEIDMRGVLPANVIVIGELRAALEVKTDLLECYRADFTASFNKCKQLILTNNMLVNELIESSAQITKLQELVAKWEKLDA
jgi:hypothetical protein